MTAVGAWIADVLVVGGLVVLTAAVLGLLRVRHFGVRLHAAAKATFLGVVPLLLAASLAGGAMTARAGLVLAFLLLTAPVSAHALARVAYRRRPRPASPSKGNAAAP